MKIKMNINRLSYICIIVGYILTLTTIPQGEIAGNIVINIGLLLALYKIFFLNHYKTKQLVLFTIIGIVFLISAYRTQNYQFVYTFIFVLSAIRMNIDKLIDIDLKIRIPLVFIVCTLGYLGIVLNRVDYDIRGFGMERQALGFTHPNNLGAMMMVITIYVFYKKHNHFCIKDYILLLIADYICWSVAVSRTSSIIITGVVVIELLDSTITFFAKTKFLQKVKHFVIAIGSVFTLIIPLGSIYLGVNYSATPIYHALDSAFSSRFYLMHTAFKNNGVALLGQYVKVISWTSNVAAEKTNAIDNLYGYILINFGIIFFVISVLILVGSYIYACKKDERKICLCILFFIAAGFCENKMFYIGTNVFTLYIALAIYQSSKKVRNRKVKNGSVIVLQRKDKVLGEKGNG